MMDNAILIGLSRQMTLRRQMDIVANNLANLGTTGFRAEDLIFEEYRMPTAEISAARRGDRDLSYVVDRMSTFDFSPGPMKVTGNPLDVALDGDGWLVVDTPQGERYTRNGSLSIGPQGDLRTADGYPVMGDAGPVTFDEDDGAVTIAGDGTMSTEQGEKGRLRVVAFADNDVLVPEGSSLFDARGAQPQDAPTVRVAQGMLEGSNVNAISEMTRMIEVNRTYTSVARMLEKADEQRRDAISTLGRLE